MMDYRYLPGADLVRIVFPFPLTPPPDVMDVFFLGRDIVVAPDGWRGVTCTAKEWEYFLCASYEAMKQKQDEQTTLMIAVELLEFRKWKLEMMTGGFFKPRPEVQA